MQVWIVGAPTWVTFMHVLTGMARTNHAQEPPLFPFSIGACYDLRSPYTDHGVAQW
ncbi:hypothetical protein FOXYSP1_07463 [Fusarium oxysporum f. sp. phaseoli]